MRGSRYLGVLALALAAAVFFAGGVASAKTASGPNCGDTVNGNVSLTHDLICPATDGLDVGSSFTSIHLNGRKIVCPNDALPCWTGLGTSSGIYTDYNNTTIVGPGTVSGFDYNVDVESDVNTVMNLSTDGGSGSASDYGVYVEGSSNQVVHVTDTKSCSAFYDDGNELANTFLNNTSIKAGAGIGDGHCSINAGAPGVGFYNGGSSMDLFKGNSALSGYGEGFYDYYGDQTTYKQNKASHGTDDGFETVCSTYNTYTQNTAVLNGEDGFDFQASSCLREAPVHGSFPNDHYNGLQVTATWNLAKGNHYDGFYFDKADSSEDSDDTGSWVANNTATGNGWDGIGAYRTYDSTFSHNWTTNNGGSGFYLEYPANSTVTGNTSTGNVEDGLTNFTYSDECLVSGPFGYCDPLSIDHNTFVHNAEFGAWSDYITSSSSNVAHNNGTAPIDCVNVICAAHLAGVAPGPALTNADGIKPEHTEAAIKPALPHHR